MKKLSSILLILSVLLLPCLIMAAGTATQTYAPVYSSEGHTNLATLTFSWTSDATGDVISTTSTTITDQIAGKYVVMAVTSPDTTAPTASYDITITDANNADIMGGKLADRSATLSEQVSPYIGALYGKRPVSGALTLNVSNAGDAKSGTGILYLSR